jgi:hypothetical protein
LLLFKALDGIDKCACGIENGAQIARAFLKTDRKTKIARLAVASGGPPTTEKSNHLVWHHSQELHNLCVYPSRNAIYTADFRHLRVGWKLSLLSKALPSIR